MIAPEFVDILPAQLHTDAAPKITKPGEVVTLSLLGEGVGGAVEFTRRAGRTYCRWVTT